MALKNPKYGIKSTKSKSLPVKTIPLPVILSNSCEIAEKYDDYLRMLCKEYPSTMKNLRNEKRFIQEKKDVLSSLIQKIKLDLKKLSFPGKKDRTAMLHAAEGIQLLTIEEEAYRKRLLELPDSPSVLYYKGQALLNQQRVVTIVGTRQLTSYGQASITKFLEQILNEMDNT
ncbi:DNA-protecting protein DprA [Nephila pilipes]|uniref:DNA-protecting protein DprA n=1 Tax=Nephila pilipes TaxID=299642 RepID=A0A8X6NH08_NEPPI|nr:DNA-protecting protein DprA [Nephila pilipes]